jgi:DNA-binding transcriptional LysR family regulator
LVRVPVPIRVINYVPVTLGDLGVKLQNWPAIVTSKLRVGARAGAKLTESMIPRGQLTSVPNYDSLLRMLLLRRIDVAIVPQGLLGDYYSNMPPELQGRLKDVQELPVFATENMYFYLHRRHAALAPAIATALQCSQETLPKKGKLPVSCRKHGVTSIKTSR